MEKEAHVLLDPVHVIRCQYPMLKQRAQYFYEVMLEKVNHIRRDYYTQDQTLMAQMQKFDPYNVNPTLDYLNSKLEGDIQVNDTYFEGSDSVFTQIREHNHSISDEADLNTDDYIDVVEIANLHGKTLLKTVPAYDKSLQESIPVLQFNDDVLQWTLHNIANRLAVEVTRISDFPCTCKGECEISLRQILNVGDNAPDVICYNSCMRTLFAAFKRQLRRVAHPTQEGLEEFGNYCKTLIDQYLDAPLAKFDYSYSQWFNKMPIDKQKKMINAEDQYEQHQLPSKVQFGLFCKREKQELGGKNRAIANIDDLCKYIMGPVTWKLENICDNYFPGYCGGKSWQSLEDYYNYAESLGFKYALQGDGSGFDLSQHAEIKDYVDYYVYNKIADKIHHVAEDDFRWAAIDSKIRQLKAVLIENKSMTNLAIANVYGTVFSGASDTTLMNTLRMALYNHYTLHKMGLRYGIDYLLLCKGDDFIVFVKDKNKEYFKHYMTLWVPKIKNPFDTHVYKKYGIGQCLKFLIVDDFTKIDFCSTCTIRKKDGTYKIIRRPERVAMFNPYSRAAVHMTPVLLKQYLNDLALALEVSHGNIPFFNNYIVAYRRAADQISADTSILLQGKPKYMRPSDGHEEVVYDGAEDLFPYYGYEYHTKFFQRLSTTEIDDDDVYNFLLDNYGITRSDIQYQLDLLLGYGKFDPIAQSILEHSE